MSNLERDPQELLVECPPESSAGPAVVLPFRDVPLGGPRAMHVRRTLPSRGRTMIGAWCFLDHYGPEDVAVTGGMRVPPHPHTGLQTVSWLFAGEIEHRDSVGSRTLVTPGAVNLMTAGRGISHSETSTPRTTTLHGVQLWVALPDAHRFVEPFFEHAEATRVRIGDAEAQVFVGSLPAQPDQAQSAPAEVTTFTPLLAAQVDVPAGARTVVPVTRSFEHGVLVDSGSPLVDGAAPAAGELAYLPAGRDRIEITAVDQPCRLVLIGGVPLEEQILMWWNFVGRTHDEVVAFRDLWQEQITRPGGQPSIGFGPIPAQDYDGPALPAPELPSVRLRPRD